MKILDLSQEIYNLALVHPLHPKPMIWQYITHKESAKGLAGGFSLQTKVLQMSDHCGTHVDALCHFNPDPAALSIENMDVSIFFGDAICIDVSFVPELNYITIDHLKQALTKSGQSIRKGDILLLYTGMYDKHGGKPEYLTVQQGLNEESSCWLLETGVKLVGIDAPSTDAYTLDPTYPNHRMSAKYGITHVENLINLDKLIGKRFTYIGLPLRIRGGTGSPLRAVAILND